MRNAASVFPEPVGAEIRTLCPAAISGQPCNCGSVGPLKRAAKHSETKESNACNKGGLLLLSRAQLNYTIASSRPVVLPQQRENHCQDHGHHRHIPESR